MTLGSIGFFNNTAKVNAAYADALSVFKEAAPYAIETQFIGEYIHQTRGALEGYLVFDTAWREMTGVELAGSLAVTTGKYQYALDGLGVHRWAVWSSCAVHKSYS